MIDHYHDGEVILRAMDDNPPQPDDAVVDVLKDIRAALVALTHATLASVDAQRDLHTAALDGHFGA